MRDTIILIAIIAAFATVTMWPSIDRRLSKMSHAHATSQGIMKPHRAAADYWWSERAAN